MPQPHWNTATTTPYDAPIDRRFISAAFSGTRIERNATTSRITATPTTAATTYGMRCRTIVAMSMIAGDSPPR